MAAAAVLNPVKEGRFILPGNGRRPADVFLPDWAEGRDAALDVLQLLNDIIKRSSTHCSRRPWWRQLQHQVTALTSLLTEK